MTTWATTDRSDEAQQRNPVQRAEALLRGLLGWLVVCCGLGIAIGVPRALDQHFSLAPLTIVALQALLMSVTVVPAIALLRRRIDRRTLAGLGWGRRVGRPAMIGAGVGVTTGLMVWIPAWLAGWIEVSDVNIAGIATFLLANTVVIVLYEALPEELALRGYTWTNLRDGWDIAVATILTTALFPVGGIVIDSVAWLATRALGAGSPDPGYFPAGSDPIAYVVQLALFGLALIAARRIPIDGALFIAVAFHATQLTVNRMLLGGTGWLDSGWTVSFIVPAAIALILLHIALGGAAFIAIRMATNNHARSTRSASWCSSPGPPRRRAGEVDQQREHE